MGTPLHNSVININSGKIAPDAGYPYPGDIIFGTSIECFETSVIAMRTHRNYEGKFITDSEYKC